MGAKFTGLSTFDPFPDGNASQVDTKARFGSELLPANLVPIWASIFGSSCYGFANSTAPLLIHSGWVLVKGKYKWLSWEILRIRQSLLRITLIKVVNGFIQEENEKMPIFNRSSSGIVSTGTAFYTYGNMLRDLNSLRNKYPAFFRISELGQTADQRSIIDVILGNPEADTQIIIQSTIHGREYLNTLLVMKQLEDILSQYDSAAYKGIPYAKLLDQTCFHILPMTNPDGVTICQRGVHGIQSKNLRKGLKRCYHNDLIQGHTAANENTYWLQFKANAHGVDLNRNFAAGWETFQGSDYPSFERYKGTAPASEIETQALLSIAERNNVICAVSYHSAGNLIYWDYGSKGSVYESNRELAEMAAGITGYITESTLQNETDAAGCSDYFVLKKGIAAITIENGSGTCPLSIDEFEAIWNANRQLWPALAAFHIK